MKSIFKKVFVPVLFSVLAAGAAHAQETADNLGDWGVDISFGNQAYMEQATGISVLSPKLFGDMALWRLTLDYYTKNLQAYRSSYISEYAISLEGDAPVYKDVAYSFVKIGVGMMDPAEDIYDGSIFTVPISLGFQVITMNNDRCMMSYFVDYRYTVYRDFDEAKSLPGDTTGTTLDDNALFSGTTSVGLRWMF